MIYLMHKWKKVNNGKNATQGKAIFGWTHRVFSKYSIVIVVGSGVIQFVLAQVKLWVKLIFNVHLSG